MPEPAWRIPSERPGLGEELASTSDSPGAPAAPDLLAKPEGTAPAVLAAPALVARSPQPPAPASDPTPPAPLRRELPAAQTSTGISLRPAVAPVPGEEAASRSAEPTLLTKLGPGKERDQDRLKGVLDTLAKLTAELQEMSEQRRLAAGA